MKSNLRIGVCFFGITRSLKFTYSSILENILAPARGFGDVKTYAHFFDQRQIHNPRTHEFGPLDDQEHKLLSADRLVLEKPDACLKTWDFERLKSFGDAWSDNFGSLRNLVHQLHSLNEVTKLAVSDGVDLVIFARPDLRYHDGLGGAIRKASRGRGPRVVLPCWQHWEKGYNDRFAICFGDRAINAYGRRIEKAFEYCQSTHSGLHAERLLRYSLLSSDLPPFCTRARASRVRIDGAQVKESFRTKVKTRLALMRDRITATD
jgi:hypothetical protein